jgi:7-dehydrocholesterol reductase
MDIQHDRAGYYICWGCLVWVPAVYTSAAFYLTTADTSTLSFPTALAMFAAGLVCIWSNYDSDRQRYVFRQTHGKCRIWGRDPRHIVATYQTAAGDTKTALLLVDGWWRISRHYHYVPEICAALCWSLPALHAKDGSWIAPYFYVVYLTILLTDRAYRDDSRCRAKYGKHWDQYCETVPYKIVPGLL